MIFEQTIDLLTQRHSGVIASLSLASVIISPVFTAVQLSNGQVGIARTETRDSKPHLRDQGFRQPGNWQGASLADLLQCEDNSGFCLPVRLAAVNAISTYIVQSGNYRVIRNTDPFDLILADKNSRVCLVGAFHSYIKKCREKSIRLKVLELDPGVFNPEDLTLYAEAGSYAEVFAQSDIIIITGSSIVNHTIDSLLAAIPPHARAILSGPTAGMLPDLLFEAGIKIVGSTCVTDPEKAMRIIAEGGSGYHLFNQGAAEKICILP